MTLATSTVPDWALAQYCALATKIDEFIAFISANAPPWDSLQHPLTVGVILTTLTIAAVVRSLRIPPLDVFVCEMGVDTTAAATGLVGEVLVAFNFKPDRFGQQSMDWLPLLVLFVGGAMYLARLSLHELHRPERGTSSPRSALDWGLGLGTLVLGVIGLIWASAYTARLFH